MKTGTLFAHLSQGNSQLQLGNAITHFPPLRGGPKGGGVDKTLCALLS